MKGRHLVMLVKRNTTILSLRVYRNYFYHYVLEIWYCPRFLLTRFSNIKSTFQIFHVYFVITIYVMRNFCYRLIILNVKCNIFIFRNVIIISFSLFNSIWISITESILKLQSTLVISLSAKSVSGENIAVLKKSGFDIHLINTKYSSDNLQKYKDVKKVKGSFEYLFFRKDHSKVYRVAWIWFL